MWLATHQRVGADTRSRLWARRVWDTRLLTAHLGDRLGWALVESNLAVNVKVFRALVFFDPVIPVLGMWPRQTALKMENAF